MNKNEFIRTLKESLNSVDEIEKNDILYDYEEHFRIGIENGKTEEEIAVGLGDPKLIGKSYTATVTVEKAIENSSGKNVFKALLAAVTLSFFNLVIVLGPFIALVGLLIGLYAASISMALAGLFSIFAIVFMPFIPFNMTVSINPIAAIFLGIGIACLGTLFFIGNCFLTKVFYKLTAKYLKWNMQVISK